MRGVTDIGAASALAHDEAFLFKGAQCLPHGNRTYPVLFGQADLSNDALTGSYSDAL